MFFSCDNYKYQLEFLANIYLTDLNRLKPVLFLRGLLVGHKNFQTAKPRPHPFEQKRYSYLSTIVEMSVKLKQNYSFVFLWTCLRQFVIAQMAALYCLINDKRQFLRELHVEIFRDTLKSAFDNKSFSE